jgi:hypothetical protein
MKALLGKVRARARRAVRQQMLARGERGEVVTPDYLEMLLAHEDRSSPHLKPLTEVVAFSRMLEQIGTYRAVSKLIEVRVRFGEFLRVDTQLALKRLADRATAALIETTRHPAPSIREWAEKRLRLAGRLDPSDALETLDPRVQADVLRAYGRIKRLDTADLLISYASSDSAPVREAARQAVAHLGQAILWPLRDAYERTLGEGPPREWPWDRVARELFWRFDRERTAELDELYNRGRKAAHEGRPAAAIEVFDAVSRRDPAFEFQPDVTSTYLAAARALAPDDLSAAISAARRAERLAADEASERRARSLRFALDAERLLHRGLVDEVLLRRAVALDPANERAERLLDELTDDGSRSRAVRDRYLSAGVIAALAALGLLVIGWRRRRATAA